MRLRTTRSSVTFRAPFRLSALNELVPAGSYDIEAENALIVSDARRPQACVPALLFLRTNGSLQIVTIDLRELRQALDADGCA